MIITVENKDYKVNKKTAKLIAELMGYKSMMYAVWSNQEYERNGASECWKRWVNINNQNNVEKWTIFNELERIKKHDNKDGIDENDR